AAVVGEREQRFGAGRERERVGGGGVAQRFEDLLRQGVRVRRVRDRNAIHLAAVQQRDGVHAVPVVGDRVQPIGLHILGTRALDRGARVAAVPAAGVDGALFVDAAAPPGR